MKNPDIEEIRNYGLRTSVNIRSELIERAGKIVWECYLAPIQADSENEEIRRVWCELINLYLIQDTAVSTLSGGSVKKRDFANDPSDRQLEINKYSIATGLLSIDSKAQVKTKDCLRVFFKNQLL